MWQKYKEEVDLHGWRYSCTWFAEIADFPQGRVNEIDGIVVHSVADSDEGTPFPENNLASQLCLVKSELAYQIGRLTETLVRKELEAATPDWGEE